MEEHEKESVLSAVEKAFRKGVGDMPLSPKGREFMIKHYSERLEAHEEDVHQGWLEFGETALRKIRLVGRDSVNQALRRKLGEVTIECIEASLSRIETVAASAWC